MYGLRAPLVSGFGMGIRTCRAVLHLTSDEVAKVTGRVDRMGVGVIKVECHAILSVHERVRVVLLRLATPQRQRMDQMGFSGTFSRPDGQIRHLLELVTPSSVPRPFVVRSSRPFIRGYRGA
jgi:hypothetical protein